VFVPSDSGHVAISAPPSTGDAAVAIFNGSRRRYRGKGMTVMQRLGLLLRSTSSRIRRRLALIADIAAASLPSAGA
jgi:hypothetical protein